MAWIRLSDDYINDEKIMPLSDGAFRLWHEGMAYCRRHHTDGLIAFPIMKSLRSFSRGRETQLSTPIRDGVAPLWELVPAIGYRVHNYLHWNLSKEEASLERAGAAARQRKFRDRHVVSAQSNAVTNAVTNAEVPVRIGIGTEKKEERVAPKPTSMRSKHPVFKGERFVVFDWMLEDLMRMLGPHADDFDLHEWFFTANALAAKEVAIVPNWWPWLQSQTLAEAKRRGLQIAGTRVVVPAPTEKVRGCRHTPPCVDAAAHTKRDLQERRAS